MEKSIFSVFLQLELSSIRTRIKSATFSGWLSIVCCFFTVTFAGCLCELLLHTNCFIHCILHAVMPTILE